MTINASKIPSVVAISQAQIATKKALRDVIVDRFPLLFSCTADLGNDPILCAENPELNHQIQHVDLGQHHADFGMALSLVTEAYNILCATHNNMTAQGVDAGIVMDAPNGGGGR